MRRRIDWTSSKKSSGVHLVVANEENVGEDVLVALVKFVEIHAGSGRAGDGMDGQYRMGHPGDRRSATPE